MFASATIHLPTYRLGNCLHPIRDLVDKIKCGGRGCGVKSRIEEREKGRRDIEGGEKVRDTGGGDRTARIKESVYTNGLADETKETK